DRKQLTAIYRAADGEQVFSLKLDAFFPTVDPNTGDNFYLANDDGERGRIFDFITNFQSATTEKVSNMKGGSVKLEDEDENDGKDERFNAELPPGAIDQCSGVDTNDPNCDTASDAAVYAGVAETKLKVDVDVRKSSKTSSGAGGSAASAASLRRVARYATAGAGMLPEAARAMEAARAQAAGDAINPLGAFYSIFLPRGIRSQLGKPVDLTLSFDPALVSGSSKTASDLNIWYQLPAGKTICPSGKAAQNGFCIEDGNKRVDTVNNTLTVSVDHFSTFVVASTPTATSTQPYGGADIVAFNFPNPFDCIRHAKTLNNVLFQGGQGTVFDGTLIRMSLPPGGAADLSVKIYNVAGELVREIPQAAHPGGFTYYTNWDCKNQGGEAVASGVYIGQVKWGDKKKFFKMAVIKGSGL
ncbi:MAG: FlgD immunoglobulin-like domain containing protein, partial [Elusimicrobiota bacterium]